MHEAPMTVDRPVPEPEFPTGLTSGARNDLLSPLSAHLDRSRMSVPLSEGRLPAEARGLRAQWAALDRFVGERVEWVLSGISVELEETEPEGLADVRLAIDRLASSDPLAARAFHESFEFLEGALAIVRRFLLESSPEIVR